MWITNVSLYVSIEKGGSFKKRGGEGEVACGDKDGYSYDFFFAHEGCLSQ